jgi:hypothetical protein
MTTYPLLAKAGSSALLLAASCALIAPVLVPTDADAAVVSASVSNFRIDVVDLDLNDGVDAGYTFLPAPEAYEYQYIDSIVYLYESAGQAVQDQQVFDHWVDAQSHSEMDGAHGTSRAGGDHFLSAEASTRDLTLFAVSQAQRRMLMRLTPNTEFTFSADIDLSITVEACLEGFCDGATSTAFMGVNDVADGGFPGPRFFKTLGPYHSKPNPSFSDLATLTLRTYEQGTQAELLFRIAAMGNTTHVIPGVPEPQTYALMLAGLAAVSAAIVRRKRVR